MLFKRFPELEPLINTIEKEESFDSDEDKQ